MHYYAAMYSLANLALPEALSSRFDNKSALDIVIQKGRLLECGVIIVTYCNAESWGLVGGCIEDTVSVGLDLCFRFLSAGAQLGNIVVKTIQKEAVENLAPVWKQRQRWEEGPLQRFCDCCPKSISNP